MTENLKIKEISSDVFKTEVLESSMPVIVDFWAPWCGPCKAITPLLEEISQENAERVKVFKVNIDNNTDLAAEYKIQSIPALIIFKNGKILDFSSGFKPKAELQKWIDSFVDGE